MSDFKAKMHQILFPASVRSSVRSLVRPFESREETRIRLPIRVSSITRVKSITNSEFSISNISSFGEEESSIQVSSSAELGLRLWKASSVELVQSGYFERSISDGVFHPEWLLELIRSM